MDTPNDTNAQPQVPPVPASTGPNVEELQARLAELEKARDGLIRDVQHERTKRQELETRISSPAPSAANSDVTEDEVAKLIRPTIQKMLAPIQAQQSDEKALNYLAAKTGKSVEQVLADRDLQDKLMGVSRKWGLVGDSYTVSKRAYELMELENIQAKEEERKRAATTANTASLPSGVAPVSSTTSKKYSSDEFNRMDPRMFGDLEHKGTFRKLSDGSFEYTPR